MGGREPSTQAGRDREGVEARHRKPGPSVTFNKSLSSFSPLSPKTVRFQQWDPFKYIPDKETFFLPFRERIKEKYPPPTHIYTHPSAVKTLSSL